MAPVVVVLATLLLLVGRARTEQQCTARRTSTIEFHVTSSGNETHQRTVAADLRGEVPAEEGGPKPPVTLHVAHWTEVCGDKETVAMNVSTTTTAYSSTIDPRSVSSVTCPTPLAPLTDYRWLKRFGQYKLHAAITSWEEARRTCEDEDAGLVVMETHEEMDAVVDMVRDSGPGYARYAFWVGVHRQGPTQPWITVLGRPMESAGFTGWWPGEPAGSEDCVYLSTTSMARGLRNVPCSWRYHFLCEK